MTGALGGRIVVFAGPSLPPALRPADSMFGWLPPAMAGDAFALAAERPRAVVLIDGVFDGLPSIRHKELLELMAMGVPLIGGASMGALRAAELHTLGMIGVGRIFAAFAAGRLEGDDEVAVMHASSEWDWAVLTEALVNVRATLVNAARGRVLDADTRRRVLQAAARLFYKERTWPILLRILSRSESASTIRTLEQWLPQGHVNLKTLDAMACLEAALNLDLVNWVPPPRPPTTLFARALADQVAVRIR
jgi:hypothetical protein